jgi:hypothetical protein
MELTLKDRIRQRAYFLSLSGGGAGDETHFWQVAEREVLAEVVMESAAASQLVEAIQSEMLHDSAVAARREARMKSRFDYHIRKSLDRTTQWAS